MLVRVWSFQGDGVIHTSSLRTMSLVLSTNRTFVGERGGDMALETLPNDNADREFVVRLDTAEVVARCPMTNLPDYYRVLITFEPDKLLVELKSLKLYFVEFMDRQIIHEDLLNVIVDDLVAAIEPRWLHVRVDVNVRGGIETTLSRMWSPDGDDIDSAVEMMLETD